MLIKMKKKSELLEHFKKNGYTKDSGCDSYYSPSNRIFTYEMFNMCDTVCDALIDNTSEYDFVIKIENENFGVKKEWCKIIT